MSFVPSLGAACLAAVLALTATAPSQALMNLGEYRSGSISGAGEVHRYYLQDAQAGDLLRITFRSQYSGYPCYCYHHRLDVTDGVNPFGSGISGVGLMTETLGQTGLLTITVRAIDGRASGWYEFHVDRINDWVGAERIAFNWNIQGSIDRSLETEVYTIRAEANSSAVLRHTSQYSGYPCYCYHHYVELLDPTFTRVAHVDGHGSAQVTFATTGIYTLLIRGSDHARTGWYATSLDCQSAPGVPCDSVAASRNYCDGLPGTNGVVPALALTARPVVGTTTSLFIGNSAGVPTPAWLVFGEGVARSPTPWTGNLCVAMSGSIEIPSLPAQGGSLPLVIPNHPLLIGLGFSMQALVYDPGAQDQMAFSRGLAVITGN